MKPLSKRLFTYEEIFKRFKENGYSKDQIDEMLTRIIKARRKKK